MNNLKQYAGLLNDEAPEDHFLAYITPGERDMLVEAGGKKTPTESGIFAYPPGEKYGGTNSSGGFNDPTPSSPSSNSVSSNDNSGNDNNYTPPPNTVDVGFQEALPYAFDQYDKERQRQLGIASAAPNLQQVGGQLENIQRQQNLAPFQSLAQYSSLVNPIASGFPVQTGQTQTNPNRVTQGMGGALIGNMIGGSQYGIGAAIGGALLGGLL